MSSTLNPLRQPAIQRQLVGLGLGLLVALGLSHGLIERFDLRFRQPQAPKTVRFLEAFRASEERVDIAFLGSSRLHAGVGVEQLERELSTRIGEDVTAFSLWIEAGSLPAYTIIARDLLKDEQRPRWIAVVMGAGSCNANSPRYRHTLRYLCSPTDLVGSRGPRHRDELLLFFDVAFRASGTLLQLLDRPTAAERAAADENRRRRGGKYPALASAAVERLTRRFERIATSYTAEVERRVPIRAAGTREEVLTDFDPGGRVRDSLEELTALCTERGVRLVVVNLPLSDRFCELTYRNGEDERYLAMVRSVCDEASVPFFDFNRPGQRPPLTDFRDGDHLNEIGSYRFTRRLVEEVFALLW